MDSNVFVNAHFPPALEYAARMEAARRRISRSELVRRAVAQYLEIAEKQQVTFEQTKEARRYEKA